jgi:hypothetical protein
MRIRLETDAQENKSDAHKTPSLPQQGWKPVDPKPKTRQRAT